MDGRDGKLVRGTAEADLPDPGVRCALVTGRRAHETRIEIVTTAAQRPILSVWRTLRVGSGDPEIGAITVIRTPARYSSFDAVAADPPPAAGQHNDLFLAEVLPEPETASYPEPATAS